MGQLSADGLYCFITCWAIVTLCTSVGPSTVAIISPLPPSGIRFDTPSAPWMCVARWPMLDMQLGRPHLARRDVLRTSRALELSISHAV